jgi:hypothetical protein
VVLQFVRTGDEIASQIRPRPLPSTSLILAQRPIIVTDFFVFFLSLSRQVLGWYLKLGHDRFLPPFFLLTVHQSFYHSTPVKSEFNDSLVM